MIQFIQWYFSVAAALYIIAVFAGFKNMLKASVTDILMGFVGAILWPYLVFNYVKALA